MAHFSFLSETACTIPDRTCFTADTDCANDCLFSGQGVLLDRSLYSDRVFADGLFADEIISNEGEFYIPEIMRNHQIRLEWGVELRFDLHNFNSKGLLIHFSPHIRLQLLQGPAR